MSPEICSSTPKCKQGLGDIWDAPSGVIGISFDDGPEEGTPKLLDFLEQQNIVATHYVIGQNIAQRPQGAPTTTDNLLTRTDRRAQTSFAASPSVARWPSTLGATRR